MSEDVKLIQAALKARLFDPGKIDGKWGTSTCRACWRLKQSWLDFPHKGYDLDSTFFSSLGLGSRGFEIKYKYSCVPYDFDFELAREIQAALKKKYFSGETVDPGVIDGICGPKTSRSFYAFQQNLRRRSGGIRESADVTCEIDEAAVEALGLKSPTSSAFVFIANNMFKYCTLPKHVEY